MFDPTSRYASVDTALYVDTDGNQIPYKRRRFVPASSTMQVVARLTVQPGDRLDLVAARALGASELFWQLCDANDAMNPFDVVDAPGTTLVLALPATQG